MGKILVTGASGLIGRAMVADLNDTHDVVALSRRRPGPEDPWIQGSFAHFEDLFTLDDHAFDAVIHLAAVTGGCAERDGILVNVEGTRCLMRYLSERGCRKFVLASSIAAVGFQSVAFRPLEMPIPDEHPCLDRDGYGVSKYLMEEVSRYVQRQVADLDVINLRLSSVRPDDDLPPLRRVGPLGAWSLGGITMMVLSDAVRAFRLAAESDHVPGVRVMNAAGPRSWVADPVADILQNWWGNDVDVSYFREDEHLFDGVYDVRRIKDEIGFEAAVLPAQAE